PECVVNVCITALDAQSNQVIKIAIRDAFDIQIDRIPVHVQPRPSGDVNLALAESERSQGMRILVRFGGQTLWLPSRPEGIGELGDGENPFIMLLLTFL